MPHFKIHKQQDTRGYVWWGHSGGSISSKAGFILLRFHGVGHRERPLRCGTRSPSRRRALGELVVRLLIFLTIRPFYGYLRITLGCDWSANDFHTQRRHGVNCFQHPQPSEYYKFKRVNRIHPTPSVCLSVSES